MVKFKFFFFFEKTIDYNKIIMSTQNNLISIIGSAEQEPKFIILVNG